VYVERDKKGGYRLWVSIADVANYVTPGNALDADAQERATSTYFPDRVLPMLPEELSNGICSLNPDVDRLTLTAEMLIGDDGMTRHVDVYESVIKSAARMTYTKVTAILDGDEKLTKEYAPLSDSFFLMRELMTVLHAMRDRRGSLDLDIPEAVVLLNEDGSTRDIVKSPRTAAHRLIEEFMLAANEAVASHLERHGVPFLYRIHEQPDEDRLADLALTMKGFGLKWSTSANVRPKHIAKVIKDVRGRPEERFINTLVLRAMKMARYSPDNAGHFGLASACYCHFTSPIRRYPDLLVHRALKELMRARELSAERKTKLAGPLPGLGKHTSDMERESEEAEREVVQLKKLQFMVDKIGLDFEGFISGVTAFGFFVELTDHFVEGLVRMTSLHDDYYEYDEAGHRLVGRHSDRTFTMGDPVSVVLDRVDLERRQMDFSLLEDSDKTRPAVKKRPGTEPVREKYRGRGRRR
jgi:ribonuclease R